MTASRDGHFKNLRVQKHVYSNGNLHEDFHFCKNNNASVIKLKKEEYHYANNRKSSSELETFRLNFSSFAIFA